MNCCFVQKRNAASVVLTLLDGKKKIELYVLTGGRDTKTFRFCQIPSASASAP